MGSGSFRFAHGAGAWATRCHAMLHVQWTGFTAAVLAASLIRVAAGAGPLPDPIVPSGLKAELQDFVTVPASSGARPLARINYLSHAGDGSQRLFVNDMRGKIYLIKNGNIEATPFLDAGTIFGGDLDTAGSQTGVAMFAFHPDYANAGESGFGKFYTVISMDESSGTPDFNTPFASSTHHDVLLEWTVDAIDPDQINPLSSREVLRIEQPTRDHNMGQLAFNPNAAPGEPDYGKLYIAMGDSGYPGQDVDPHRVAQDTLTPYGSILRIDPLQKNLDPYTVPDDNPFVSDGAFLPEIWSYGYRNPHRFSWDSEGEGKMLISDIGQHNIEEVNLGQPMLNHGWSEREGTFVFNHADAANVDPLPPDDATFGYSYPVVQYDHDEGRAIVGGFVYRGDLVPYLKGQYIFGDIANGRIFHVDIDDLVDGTQTEAEELTLIHAGTEKTLLEILGNDFRADLRFGIGEDGELYVLTKRDGVVRRLLSDPSIVLGDMDCDGDLDLDDVDDFVLGLTDTEAYEAMFGIPSRVKGDIDRDGDQDLDDVDGFVDLLTMSGGGQSGAVPEPSTITLLALAFAAWALGRPSVDVNSVST